jgi:hypothetical protein
MMYLLVNVRKMKTKVNVQAKCDNSVNHLSDGTNQLDEARRVALNDCSAALQSVIALQVLMNQVDADCKGNISDAKKDLLDAMVNITLSQAKGSYRRAKSILAEYGLEDII